MDKQLRERIKYLVKEKRLVINVDHFIGDMRKLFGKELSIKQISNFILKGMKFEPNELYIEPSEEKLKRKFVIYKDFLKGYLTISFYYKEHYLTMFHMGKSTHDEIMRCKEERRRLKNLSAKNR